MSHVPLRARTPDFGPDQQAVLREWAKNVNADADKIGLWVCGPRRAGTSYVCEAAMHSLEDGISTWEHIDALEMTQAIRNLWNLESLVRQHPEDYPLWQEMDAIQTELDFAWKKCEVLWVDDLHDEEVDAKFWRKHVQGWLERRVKAKLITLVATTMPPDHPKLLGLEKVITDLFVVCDVPGDARR